jgi:phosphoglycolate phosphatase-like HAD superfamily hydrolase
MHYCLFDIDGTLLNSGGAGQAAMEAALLKMFSASNPVHGISTAGRTDRAIVSDLFAFFQIAFDEAVWEEFVAAYLEELPRQLATREGLVLPGVLEILETLHARDDVKMGLLTGNFARGANVKLAHFQLDHYFSFGGYGDHHHHRDDVAREAFKLLQESHHEPVRLERLWVIGDTPADVQCGRAIGAKVVAVGTGLYSLEELEPANADHLFADFSDPGRLLSLLQ